MAKHTYEPDESALYNAEVAERHERNKRDAVREHQSICERYADLRETHGTPQDAPRYTYEQMLEVVKNRRAWLLEVAHVSEAEADTRYAGDIQRNHLQSAEEYERHERARTAEGYQAKLNDLRRERMVWDFNYGHYGLALEWPAELLEDAPAAW